MEKAKLRPVDYQSAIDVQCACNVSGVIHSLSKLVTLIWDEAHTLGKGTEYVNTHPLVIAYTAQIVYLSTGEYISTQAQFNALEYCERMAKGEPCNV